MGNTTHQYSNKIYEQFLKHSRISASEFQLALQEQRIWLMSLLVSSVLVIGVNLTWWYHGTTLFNKLLGSIGALVFVIFIARACLPAAKYRHILERYSEIGEVLNILPGIKPDQMRLLIQEYQLEDYGSRSDARAQKTLSQATNHLLWQYALQVTLSINRDQEEQAFWESKWHLVFRFASMLRLIPEWNAQVKGSDLQTNLVLKRYFPIDIEQSLDAKSPPEMIWE